MGLEIEKKYRLSAEQRAALVERLGEQARGVEFEENTIFRGPGLATGQQVLRLRRVGARAILTYKERHLSDSAIKRQREDETGITDPEALLSILSALGYEPALVYEKRRTTWKLEGVEVVIDELPFGLFAEIEGEEEMIVNAEGLLGLAAAEAEMSTYPELAAVHGVRREDLIEARFSSRETA